MQIREVYTKPDHHGPPSAPNPRKGLVTGGLLLLASGGIFFTVFQDAGTPQAPSSATTGPTPQEIQKAARDKMGRFYDTQANPLIQQARAKDLAAVEKAGKAVEALFTNYAAGAPKFANDLTGWGTRFKVIYRKGVETVEGKDEHTWTQELIQEKFAKHIVSDAQMEKDLVEITKQFGYELEANRKEMLASIQDKLTAADLPAELKAPALEEIRSTFDSRVKELLAQMPGRSVTIGVGSLTAGIVAEEAVRQVIRVVVAQMATRLAATAATAGGAAGGAAAAGAGGGSVIAPGVGTAIGLAGGFLVGAVVDWWMTDKFEAKVSEQCREFLIQTQTSLISGQGGLKPMFEQQVEQNAKLYDAALRESLQLPSPAS